MKIRVMICDDNEEFVADARAHFAASDKIELIETAANGKQALERLDTARPDVLLLDLVMPTLDGFLFAQQRQMQEAVSSSCI